MTEATKTSIFSVWHAWIRQASLVGALEIRFGFEKGFSLMCKWPLLAGVRPNDPNLAPPFIDPRETLENPDEKGLDDEIPMFPSPARPEPAGVEPAASSAGAEPSARAPADLESDHMDVMTMMMRGV